MWREKAAHWESECKMWEEKCHKLEIYIEKDKHQDADRDLHFH